MIEVELPDVANVCLIVGHPTGVRYEHQCGGLACRHNTLEGFLVPLEESAQMAEALSAYFYDGPKYQGHCYDGFDEDDARFVDALIAAGGSAWARVDRQRLADCCEAWVFLKIEAGYICVPYCYGSDPGTTVVMIWENSD